MKLFSNKYRALFILLLASYSFLNTAYIETFRYYGIEQSNVYIWLVFVIIVGLVWEGNRLLEKWLTRKKPAVHPLLLMFLLSMAIAAIAGLASYYGMANLLNMQTTEALPIEAKLCLLFAMRINLFLNCLNAINFFLISSKQKELEAEALRATTAKAQLDAVRSQVNPHFLFNNLNVLSSLVMTQNKDANSFLESFSTVYRYVLRSQEKDMVTLDEEMEFMEPYLFLLQKRFGDGLNVSIDIPDSSLKSRIVPLAMQMLVENAIKHNIVSVHQPLNVSISVRNGQLVVSNRLQPKAPDNSSGTGLQNISERYRLSTGKTITVEKTDDAFTVRLPLQS